MSKTELRCTTCGIWSDAKLMSCPTCGSPRIAEVLNTAPAAIKTSALDRFFDGWAGHSNSIVRGVYTVLKSIWIVYMAIVAFFLWLIAAMPG